MVKDLVRVAIASSSGTLGELDHSKDVTGWSWTMSEWRIGRIVRISVESLSGEDAGAEKEKIHRAVG